MTKVIIVDKNGDLKETNLKDFKVENLFKKCGLRKNKDFGLRHTWKYNNKFISLFSKDSGRANNENKYDLPPPLDEKLYFGKMLLVCHDDKELTDDNSDDLPKDLWEKCYEKLFGGFEDLGDEDSYSEEEDIPENMKTKEGYSKEDGFIVDDDEDLDEDYVPNNSEEEITDGDDEDEDEEVMGKDSDLDDSEEEEDDDDDDEDEYDSDEIGSELSEESYISSDDD